jgi:hypothetical protein
MIGQCNMLRDMSAGYSLSLAFCYQIFHEILRIIFLTHTFILISNNGWLKHLLIFLLMLYAPYCLWEENWQFCIEVGKLNCAVWELRYNVGVGERLLVTIPEIAAVCSQLLMTSGRCFIVCSDNLAFDKFVWVMELDSSEEEIFSPRIGRSWWQMGHCVLIATARVFYLWYCRQFYYSIFICGLFLMFFARTHACTHTDWFKKMFCYIQSIVFFSKNVFATTLTVDLSLMVRCTIHEHMCSFQQVCWCGYWLKRSRGPLHCWRNWWRVDTESIS